MSDIVIPAQASDTPSLEDVQRTLSELQRRNTDLEREATTERTRRVALETTLDHEKSARTSAERERDTNAAKVQTEAELRWAAEKTAAAAAIEARKNALEAAEDDYARHAEMGEWKEAAKVQTKIGSLTAELHQNQQKIEWLEQNKEKLVTRAPAAPARTEPARADTPHQPANPANHKYARYVTGELLGGEEAWLDARPKFATDEGYRERVFKASALASMDHPRGSEAYLQEMSRLMKEADVAERDQQRDNPPPAASSSTSSRVPSADLPASRRAGPGQSPVGSAQDIRLTADEVEVADGLYGDPNNDWYIADTAQRYRHYHTMKQRKSGRG